MSAVTQPLNTSQQNALSPSHIESARHAIGSNRIATPTPISAIQAASIAAISRGADFETAKRVIDLILSSIAILVLLPVYVGIATAIKLTSRGPVLFIQQRVGRRGRLFACLKFRTMVVNAEEILQRRPELRQQVETNGKVVNDPRLTSIGRFLRETSLDELPQFFNVLIGDLSLIGPRALLPSQLSHYGDQAPLILMAKPGLGGIWQSSGRSLLSFEERVQMDLRYAEKRSGRLDAALLYQTVVAVLKRKGAK